MTRKRNGNAMKEENPQSNAGTSIGEHRGGNDPEPLNPDEREKHKRAKATPASHKGRDTE